ncbi:AAA family ATPase [Pseudomonas sp. NFACC37-1]|uniref:AAA family ATPase n=1 Tax=Pseudomonas sp. NFACC37-1 TaxID=1566196 RepID=UPI0008908EAC|nr:AAA family ATPase [Pseudomonas sp. NFACC37-1]SCY34902.1 AAA domain-containing protein, putative AbiEii toxin, Type IV TA system [Pseudomonas sp. NFACC37-1]
MATHIQKIGGQIPDSGMPLNIPLNGKNLIITGSNGAGKTWFLKQLNTILISKIMMNDPSCSTLQRELDELIKKGDPGGNGDLHYEYTHRIDFLRQQINHYASNIYLEVVQGTPISSHLVIFFEADRKSSIGPASSISSVEDSKAQWRGSIEQNVVGGELERHLVNLKSRAAIVARYESDESYAQSIDEWFVTQEQNLKLLMEDDSTQLVYDSRKDSFTITREGKRDTNFQSLSSGYSSVFSVYGEILMRTEILDISPAEFEAVVFIDEIETHLHVSLQRLILPFFKSAFPKVQFIVTTHSPFILTSTTDAVVYDISTNAVIDADLSLYSYSAVMKGIMHTKPTSVVLEDIVKSISALINSEKTDTLTLRIELNKLLNLYEFLDDRTKTFYQLGEKTLSDSEAKNVQG